MLLSPAKQEQGRHFCYRNFVITLCLDLFILCLLFYFILFTFKQYHVYKWECCNKIVVVDKVWNEDKTVSVTCTTGTACKSLPPSLHATTLHPFAGIKDGGGSLNQLLVRIDGNSGAKERWRKTDVLVLDERKDFQHDRVHRTSSHATEVVCPPTLA